MTEKDKRGALKSRIAAAAGNQNARLVLKNGRVVNVFTNEIEEADVAVEDGYIVGVGDYSGETEIDLAGQYVCPGLIDGHIHLESSMISPQEFAEAVVPHGTSAVITDPHEIANVAGLDGIDYMLKNTESLPMDVYFVLPSCVPSTALDESGAHLTAKELSPYYDNERVVGLAEMMNAFGTVRGDDEILNKILDAKAHGRVVDGHAPGIAGKELSAYVTAGVESDHECAKAEEAVEKVKRGQWVMIREGTAAKNLSALLPLFGRRYYHRCMLVTDDKHPEDLIRKGHIDYIIREAVKRGADPIHAIRMGSLHAAQYFGIEHMGAVAPGYRADFITVSDLEEFTVTRVFRAGTLIAENGRLLKTVLSAQDTGRDLRADADIPGTPEYRVYHSFHMEEVKKEDIRLERTGNFQRVIGLTPGELLTKELIVPFAETKDCAPGVDTERDIIKVVLFERHLSTGHIGIGYLYNYGLKKGAVASSIGHDSHNLIVAGTNDDDIVLAANTVRANGGGLCVLADGEVLGELALPIAGIMCDKPAGAVEKKLNELKRLTRSLGVSEAIDPFMTLAFVSLPVIPELRLTTFGLADTATQQIVKSVF